MQPADLWVLDAAAEQPGGLRQRQRTHLHALDDTDVAAVGQHREQPGVGLRRSQCDDDQEPDVQRRLGQRPHQPYRILAGPVEVVDGDQQPGRIGGLPQRIGQFAGTPRGSGHRGGEGQRAVRCHLGAPTGGDRDARHAGEPGQLGQCLRLADPRFTDQFHYATAPGAGPGERLRQPICGCGLGLRCVTPGCADPMLCRVAHEHTTLRLPTPITAGPSLTTSVVVTTAHNQRAPLTEKNASQYPDVRPEKMLRAVYIPHIDLLTVAPTRPVAGRHDPAKYHPDRAFSPQ
uniref:Uncharacterized protein n=1 Tax=Verrucosispora sp. MS100047 TaxID=1410949 RepID=A0A097CSY4_9ACTN|nr:hypothetical protein VASRM7_511 [Verrucosispora sp. MS100047]